MKAYKGFDQQLRCRNFQYEIGKKYQTDTAILCQAGFHACEHPLDTFEYYDPHKSRYCIVNLQEVQKNKNKPDKICGKEIEILKELSLTEIVEEAVNCTKNHINKRVKQTIIPKKPGTKTKPKEDPSTQSTATNTGFRSAATNTGCLSAATNTGNYSTATNTGFRSTSANTGHRSTATNTGNYSAATNTGINSAATNTGHCSAASNTGNYSTATNTGKRSIATNTGYDSVAANTGDASIATNTGDGSIAANTGFGSTVSNTGEYSAALTTGAHTTAIVKTKNSIAIAIGNNSKAKGVLGSYIMLTEWKEYKNTGQWNISSAKLCKVDGKKIKPDTFYILKNRKVMEFHQQT